jgi:outer membrane protein TolC
MDIVKTMKSITMTLLLLATSVFSAEGVEKFTLNQAVRIALERNFDVLSAQTERERAEGALISARSGMYPSLALDASSTHREDTGAAPKRVDGAAVALSQTLYAGGTLRSGERQALIGSEKADQELEYAKESVAKAVCESWYDLLQKEADTRTADEALAYYTNAWMESKKRVELGLSTRLELARADQQRVNARADLISAQKELAKAKVSLLTLLRIAPETEVEIDGRLETVAVEGDAKHSLEKALSTRPDLHALVLEEEVRKEAIIIAAGGMKPTVKLTASYRFNDTSSSLAADNANEWAATLSVGVPVYDGGYAKGRVRSEKALQEQARQSTEKKRDTIREEILTAWMTLVSTLETAEAAKQNVDLARESLRLAEVGYREGVSTQLDVLQARSSLTEAQQKLAGSLKEHNLAFVALRMAEGTLASVFEDVKKGE